MWLPPTWLIQAALSGGARRWPSSGPPLAQGRRTKVVSCEKCQRRYAYELERSGANAEQLEHLLATGVEAIPCPACGWYQSDMIPQAQTRNRRWMLSAGQCLTVGLIPVAAITTSINVTYADQSTGPPIPWPIFAAGAAVLVGLLAVGIGLLWKYTLRHRYDPNREDAEARKRYGQSRATLLSEQVAEDLDQSAVMQMIRCPVCRAIQECDPGASGRPVKCASCGTCFSVSPPEHAITPVKPPVHAAEERIRTSPPAGVGSSGPQRMGQLFAREEGIDLDEKFVRTVANEYEANAQLGKWRLELPAVPSAYEPSGALPASAVLFLLLGSVVGCVAGFFAAAVIGSTGLGLAGAIFLDGNLPGILRVIGPILLFLLTTFGAYSATGWVSAWCTTRIGEWGKNRNTPAAALLSAIASVIPGIVVCACFFNGEFITGHKSALEKVATGVSPRLASWLFSNPFAVISAVLGIYIAPGTAAYFALTRVPSVKFCERCNSYMRVSGRRELTLGCLRGLVRAVRKGRLDVAASLLHGPSWGDGEVRLHYCRHCSHGYFEVTVTYAAHWKAANPISFPPNSAREPTEKSEAWLVVSCELAAPDTERLRQELLGITDSP
jgi:hypothetical protein